MTSSIEPILNHRFSIVPLILAALLAPVSAAQAEDRGFDTSTLRLQTKAEELYRNGHWERAHFIYVNELAVIGDKYSQYMAGYMCLHGKGVPRDKVKASAWYRLAAERGGADFVAVRDQILESMSEEDRQASDAVFIDLRKRFSDLVLMLDNLEREREAINASPTGSRLPGSSSPVTVVDPQSGRAIARSDYVRRLEKNMQVKLDYIAEKLDTEPLDAHMSDREFNELRESVMAYLQVINDR